MYILYKKGLLPERFPENLPYLIEGNVKERIETFLKVRNKYDVFHFNYGSTLVDFMNYGVHFWDLPFYKGKKIITYNGCDARQKYPTMNRVDFSACHQDNPQ